MNRSQPRRSPAGRYRGRSSSRERSRTRTYDDDDRHSESYPSDYSDDFEPDTKSRNRTPPRRRRGNDRSRRRGDSYYSDQYSSTSELHSSSSKKTTQSVGRRTYAKSRPRHGSRAYSEKRAHSNHRPDVITARLLSAKQRRINEIQNELAETEQRLGQMAKENKLLKTVQHRQDKALRRFQDVESDLPRLISQNFEEQKVLKARLRKAQDAEKTLEEKLRDNNDDMQKMEKTLRKLKKVVYDKNLGERSELARQLTNTENDLSTAERKIKELEKKLELMTSSYTRQIKTERQKHKETKEKLDTLVEEHQTIMAKLREKERALGVSNIYSLRNKESPSVKSTPRKQLEFSSLEAKNVKGTKGKGELKKTEPFKIEPKEFKHDKEFKKYAHKEQLPSPGPSSPAPFAIPPVNHANASNAVGMNGLHSTSQKDETPQKESVFVTSKFSLQSPSPDVTVVDRSLEFEKPDEDISNLRSSIHMENKPVDDLTELEKQKKLEQEEAQRKKLQEEEMLKQKKLEEERAKLAADQKKKAALLAKMREIDQDEDSPRSPLGSVAASSVTDMSKPVESVEGRNSKLSSTFVSNPKSKADKVRSLLGTDTDPVVENLHMGLPSNSKRPDKPEKELSFGGYAPSVGEKETGRKARAAKVSKLLGSDSDNEEPLLDLNSGKQAKNSDLLSQLFGDQSKSDKSTSEQKLGESVTPRAKPVHSGYPWEKNVVTSTHGNGNASNTSKLKVGLTVKSSTPVQDDDIEELSL